MTNLMKTLVAQLFNEEETVDGNDDDYGLAGLFADENVDDGLAGLFDDETFDVLHDNNRGLVNEEVPAQSGEVVENVEQQLPLDVAHEEPDHELNPIPQSIQPWRKRNKIKTVPMRKNLVPTGQGVRKSKRKASRECRTFLKQIAVRLANGSDDDGEYVPQVDGNYTLAIPAYGDAHDTLDVFDAGAIAFFSGAQSSARTEQDVPDAVRAYQLTQQLDLAVTDGCSASLFHSPSLSNADNLTRSRILSISAGFLPECDLLPESLKQSRWRRRLLRLRAFLDRLPLFQRR